MDDTDRRFEAHLIFKCLPGYPFVPCRICVGEGFKGEACDHTVLERAQALHPGLNLSGGGRA